jgi:hypothetical protein
MRPAVALRPSLICGFALTIAISAAAQARDFEMGGDNEYPNSIMAPEPGSAPAHRAAGKIRKQHFRSSQGRVKFFAGPKTKRHLIATRGSSGSVLPTPLPRTPLIAPEGTGRITTPALPQEQGATIVPGSTTPIPNLPHGPETFQDRASRCAHQGGLNGVPSGAMSQYMGACAM